MQADVTTFSGRLLAYFDMHLVDHGLFRLLYNNFYALPGGLYRCSQPSPGQIRRYQRKYGIKTVINLRGADQTGRYALEEECCRKQGIKLINFKGILSRSAPYAHVLDEARLLFTNIEYPVLIHCKSGADRAGFAAAIYRLFRLNEPVQDATRELAWYYGHIKASKTGILDFFFEEYLAVNATDPIDFDVWLHTRYNRDETKKRFRVHAWADFIVDRILHRE